MNRTEAWSASSVTVEGIDELDDHHGIYAWVASPTLTIVSPMIQSSPPRLMKSGGR